MSPASRSRFRALGPLLLLVLGVALGLLWPALRRAPLVIGQDAAYPGAQAQASWSEADGGVIDIRPVSGRASTLLVLYPGGLVRPQAYQWLATALAPSGVETVIVRFPLDLAVTGVNRADAVIARYAQGRPVVLAGHSLGGAMAAQYVSAQAGKVKGLILMGAYPAGNVSLKAQTGLRVLDLLAEHDAVAVAANVKGGLARLPDSTRLVMISGSVHSFFGRYGPQRGDGKPTVTRAEAEAQIVREVKTFLRDE
jgi:pimeloyl-ACP methyl ester carboxylesterase